MLGPQLRIVYSIWNHFRTRQLDTKSIMLPEFLMEGEPTATLSLLGREVHFPVHWNTYHLFLRLMQRQLGSASLDDLARVTSRMAINFPAEPRTLPDRAAEPGQLSGLGRTLASVRNMASALLVLLQSALRQCPQGSPLR